MPTFEKHPWTPMMHLAAEMVHQAAAGLDCAHEIEAAIGYGLRDSASLTNKRHVPADNGPSL